MFPGFFTQQQEKLSRFIMIYPDCCGYGLEKTEGQWFWQFFVLYNNPIFRVYNVDQWHPIAI
jgi:hypothetical protein